MADKHPRKGIISQHPNPDQWGLPGVLGQGMMSAFNTQLTPEEQIAFQLWAGDRSRDKYDYDIQGFWKSGSAFAKNGHGSDRFKKPNHPTFSDQSQYSGVLAQGGQWMQNQDGSWTFAASPLNLNSYGADDLLRYFAEVEPGNKLKPPKK